MNKILEKYLSPDLSKKLIDYFENQIKPDLENFEDAFGYKGNTSLVKWLIINNLFNGNEIEFLKDDEGYLPIDVNVPNFLLYSNIFNSIKKRNLLENHTIGNHYFGGFIELFTSSFMISGDGMGNYFYANFHSTNSDIIFFDHENSMDSYKALTMDDLLKIQPIQYLELIIDLIVLEKGADFGLDNLDYKEGFQFQNDSIFKEEIFNFMILLGRNRSLNELTQNFSPSPFSTENELSNLLTNQESDYHKYGNVRAEYNPIVIANLYWFYLTNQAAPLLQLLDDSKNIKGKYYLAIRNSFEEIMRSDFSKFNYSYGDLNRLRSNLNLQSSSIIEGERKHFAKEIEEIELNKAKKKAAELALQLKHQDDNYYLLSEYGDWGLYPEDTKFLRERPLNNLKEWENPEPIITKLKHHHQTTGEPKVLADILPWLSGTSFGKKNLVVSERLKDILLKHHLQKHNFYSVPVKSHGKVLPYFVYVPFLDEETFEIIDYSKTIFYAQKRYAPKEILADNIQFKNYQEYIKAVRFHSQNGAEIKYKDQEIYLNTPVDLFVLIKHGFYVSKKLKQELEEKNITVNFSPLAKFPSLLAFTKVNVSNSNIEEVLPTEISTEKKEEVLEDSKIKNILNLVDKAVLDKSKVSLEVQQRIKDDFPSNQQNIMMLVAQKVLPSHGGEAVLDSLFILAKGKLENINNRFPIYDFRDVLMSAQSQKKVFENHNFEEEGYSIIFEETRSGANLKYEITDLEFLKRIKRDWVFKPTNSLGRCGDDYHIQIKKDQQIVATYSMCFSCKTLFLIGSQPIQAFEVDVDFVMNFIKKT